MKAISGLRPIILIFVALGLLNLSTAVAQNLCRKSLVKIQQQTNPQFLKGTFSNLVVRLSNVQGDVSQKLNLQLHFVERMEIADSFERTLTKLKDQYLEGSLEILEPYKLHVGDLLANVARLRKSASYEEILRMSVTISSTADILIFANRNFVNPNPSSFFRGRSREELGRITGDEAWRDDKATILAGVRKEIVYIPTDRPLSIIDFNELAGSGIAPVGLIHEYARADRINYSPRGFITHDFAHGFLQIPERFNARQMKFWKSLLKVVNAMSPRERSIMHILLFMLTHENMRYKSDIMNAELVGQILANKSKTTNEGLEYLQRRLRTESNWDRPELEVNPPSIDDLANARDELARLIQLIAEKMW
jgi:hypothetical protein